MCASMEQQQLAEASAAFFKTNLGNNQHMQQRGKHLTAGFESAAVSKLTYVQKEKSHAESTVMHERR